MTEESLIDETRLCPECHIGTLLPEVRDHIVYESILGTMRNVHIKDLTVGKCPWCLHIDLDDSATSWDITTAITRERNKIADEARCKVNQSLDGVCDVVAKPLPAPTTRKPDMVYWLFVLLGVVLLVAATVMCAITTNGGP